MRRFAEEVSNPEREKAVRVFRNWRPDNTTLINAAKARCNDVRSFRRAIGSIEESSLLTLNGPAGSGKSHFSATLKARGVKFEKYIPSLVLYELMAFDGLPHTRDLTYAGFKSLAFGRDRIIEAGMALRRISSNLINHHVHDYIRLSNYAFGIVDNVGFLTDIPFYEATVRRCINLQFTSPYDPNSYADPIATPLDIFGRWRGDSRYPVCNVNTLRFVNSVHALEVVDLLLTGEQQEAEAALPVRESRDTHNLAVFGRLLHLHYDPDLRVNAAEPESPIA